MFKYFVIVTILLHCYTADAQSGSPKKPLSSLTGQEKLKALQCLTKKYISLSPDSCVKYGSATIALARQLHDYHNEALANKRIGYSYYLKGNYEKCLPYYKNSYDQNIANRDYLNAAEITNLYGDLYNQKGEYGKAIRYFTETENSCDSLIKNNAVRGSVKKMYSILYTNFGLLYYNIDSTQKALNYFHKALVYATENNDSTRIAASYCNIGMVYKSRKNFSDAADEYLLALTIARNIRDQHYEAKILNNLANTYEAQNKTDSALLFAKMARKISAGLGDKSNLSVVERNIARYYFVLGQYDLALRYITSSVALTREIGAYQRMFESYKVLSDVYEKTGKKDLALKYYKRYEELKDSVSGKETREKIAEIQTKYETVKKEKENEILRKENQIKELSISRKNTLLSVFTLVTTTICIFLLLIALLYRKKNKAYHNLVSQNLKLLTLEKQVDQSIVTVPDTGSLAPPESTDAYGGLGLRLQKFLIEEKPYLWAEVSMDEFCKKLNTNRTYLSKIINDQYHQNFFDLICEYRIRAARDMLKDETHKHLSVEGIGEFAGFKSNSHFHKKFKKLVGLTPNQFRDMAIKSKSIPE